MRATGPEQPVAREERLDMRIIPAAARAGIMLLIAELALTPTTIADDLARDRPAGRFEIVARDRHRSRRDAAV
jgi:hypothetical protein